MVEIREGKQTLDKEGNVECISNRETNKRSRKGYLWIKKYMR